MINIKAHIENMPTYYLLSVVGEIDASSSIYLEEGLRQAMSSSSKILVDLTSLTYISSAGLGVFMSILQDLESNNIQLHLFGMSENVFEVFEILGLIQLFNINRTKEEAISRLQ